MTQETYLKQLNTLKLANFDWVKGQEDVFYPASWDLLSLHKRVVSDFALELVRLMKSTSLLSPSGMIITGQGGAGKTHLLGRFCQITLQNKGYFLMVDLSGVRDLLESVLEGMLRSLLVPLQELKGLTQAERLAREILKSVSFQIPQDFHERHQRGNLVTLNRDLERVLRRLSMKYPRESMEYFDILRSIFLLNSKDPLLQRLALSWLQGKPLDSESALKAGFKGSRPKPELVISGLSFFMALGGLFQVLALDQMDHLTSLFVLLSHLETGDRFTEARRLIANISDGIGRLTTLCSRTLTVISCLPITWENLSQSSLNTSLERYRRPPIALGPLNSPDMALQLVSARMLHAANRAGYTLPYPSWPFKKEAFDNAADVYPRTLLEACHILVRELILDSREGLPIEEIYQIFEDASQGAQASLSYDPLPLESAPLPQMPIQEEERAAQGDSLPYLFTFQDDAKGRQSSKMERDSELIDSISSDPEPLSEQLGPAVNMYARYQELLASPEISELKNEEKEDEAWPQVLSTVLESYLANKVGAPYQTLTCNFDLEHSPPLYHCLLCCQNSRDRRASRSLYLRAMLKENPKAFKSRLDKLVEESGISRNNKALRLVILRFTPKPSGEATASSYENFESRGGMQSKPSDQDLAILLSIQKLKEEYTVGEYQVFMEKYRPWEKLLFLEGPLEWLSAE
ncbi:MAG: hypothetical protein LBE38_11265 [Deltaproteobacteria bacterium]|jgi:hypothetical protein|nr:hypothetical protein [Deltaproteobacteria bacterium]